MKTWDNSFSIDPAAWEQVAGLGGPACELLAVALAHRQRELLAARLTAAGIGARTESAHGGRFPLLMVYDPADEQPGVWADEAEARRLIDIVRNLPPAEAWARWSPTVAPLAPAPYTAAEARTDAAHQRAEIQRRLDAGEIDAESAALMSPSDDDLLVYSDAYIGLAEAAEICGLTASRLAHMAQDGLIPARKLGRDWFIRRDDAAKIVRRAPGPRKSAGGA